MVRLLYVFFGRCLSVWKVGRRVWEGLDLRYDGVMIDEKMKCS